MNELFNGLEYIRAYIDDLLIISNGNFEDHLNKVKIALKILKAAGFIINAEKSFFAIYNLILKHLDKVQCFYYRDKWKHISDILAP